MSNFLVIGFLSWEAIQHGIDMYNHLNSLSTDTVDHQKK